MTNKNTIWKVIAVLAVAIAAIAVYFTYQAKTSIFAGAVPGLKLAENYDPYIRYNGGYYSLLPISTQGSLQIGASGTSIPKIIEGTCPLIGVNANITASTTVSFDCAVTGAASGDVVFAMFATTSPTTAGPGWEVTRASASTTAGFITLNITNGTGASAYPPASIASTTQYLVY